MNVIFRLLRLCLGGCRHLHLYRERRELYSTLVLHWVCEDCGYAVPAIRRSPSEHQLAVQQGAVKPARVQRLSADVGTVVGFSTRRRRPRDAWRRATSG